MKTTILLNLVVLLVTTASGPAATRLVPDEYATIQAAIDAAVDGDVVIVAPDTYTGDGNRDIDFHGKAITVRSQNGPQNCAIDCNGTGTEPHRGFYFHSNEDANSVADGFTITNGHGFIEPEYSNWYLGGGIYCTGSGPTITNCIITGNSATQGGGIFAWKNSSPTITNCTISENTGAKVHLSGPGGGIHYWRNSTARIENCIISANKGRGIYCSESSANILNCTIANNGMDGIDSHGDGPLTISNCRISDNRGSGIGALVRGTDTATISNCVITGNNASFDGGGIRVATLDDGVLNVTNCTITGNSAIDHFGHIGRGGGISCRSTGDTVITNSIVCNNIGGDIYVWNFVMPPNGNWTTEPTELTVSYSCPGVIFVQKDPIFGDPILIFGDGNIDADPLFVEPGYWAANGTPEDANDDFWVDGNYHLKSAGWRWDTNRKVWTWDDVTSRCIDAGNPGCALGDELLSVPDDPNNEWGENLRINMGAYGGTAEASMGLPGWALLADLTNDGIVDFVDLAAFVNYWLETGQCIPSDLNRSQSVDFSDFAIFADNWLRYEPPTDELAKPGLARYYVPYDNPVEPSAPGYSLPLNLGAVGNYADMDSKFGLSSVAPLLEQNGFAVMEYDFHDSNDIVKPYEYLRKMDVPLFVTADTLLHLYHVQFDETLKDVEEREFVSDINELTAVLLDGTLGLYEEYTGDLKEAALRNVAYLAVAQKLIDPNAEVPQLVTDVVASELAKIDAHAGFAPSDIFIYLEDYSQYVPRGHYTRSEELKRYFRTLMWYGRMAFLLKGAESWGPMGEALISVYDAKVQTMQAVLLATSLEAVQVGARSGTRGVGPAVRCNVLLRGVGGRPYTI